MERAEERRRALVKQSVTDPSAIANKMYQKKSIFCLNLSTFDQHFQKYKNVPTQMNTISSCDISKRVQRRLLYKDTR
jgi:hypothetical protein